MKRLLFFLVLLPLVLYPQGKKSVLTTAQKDTIRTMIGYINIKDYGAVGDSVTDDTDAFQDAINSGSKIFIPEGIYTVDSLVLDNETELVGTGNGSKLFLKSGATVLIEIKGDAGYLGRSLTGNIKVKDLWLSGGHESAFAYSNPQGTDVGIKIDNANNIYIQNCKITGFDLAGITGEKTDTTTIPTDSTITYTFGTHVTDCFLESNYIGIWAKEKFEYGVFSNNVIQGYVYGVKLIGGNNSFVNNQILNGYYGVWMGAGVNDSHGSFTGGSINHNTYAIYCDSVRTTQNFTGMNIWYGSIKFNFSRGIRIMNSTIINDSIFFTGGDCANSGFINCTFDDFIEYIGRDKGTDQSIMYNNNFFGTLTGLTDQEINDIPFTPALIEMSGIPTVEYNRVNSSYTQITNNTDINFGSKDFTIEWFGYVVPNDSFQILVDKVANVPANYVGYQLAISSDNVFYFNLRGVDETYSSWGVSPEIEEGFYHVIATKNGVNLAFYINGDSIDEFSRPLFDPSEIYFDSTYSSITSTGNLRLGRLVNGTGTTDWYYTGGMNLVRLYNFAVSVPEARKMFLDGQPQLSEVPYKYKWGNQDSLTSGTLELGKTYIIDNWITGDNFTNVGGTNADSSIFVATGTTPTTWSNSSILRKLGCVAEYRAENTTASTWFDNSTNNLDGTNYNINLNPSVYTTQINAIIRVPDTTGITAGYVPKKQADGTILWQPDISTSGSGIFNPDEVWIDTTALGLATVTQEVKDTIALVKNKLNASDTTSLSNRINLKLDITDTTGFRTFSDLKYLDAVDTLSLSNRINLKLNATDTTSLSNRINLKLTATDTASLSNRINLKLNATDTTSLSNRINLKLNINDTTGFRTFSDLKYLEESDSTGADGYATQYDLTQITGGTDNSTVIELIHSVIDSLDISDGYYVSSVASYSGDGVPMTINSDSGDVLIINVTGITNVGWSGELFRVLYNGTNGDPFAATGTAEIVSLMDTAIVVDSSDVSFGIYCEALDGWANLQTATVITLKRNALQSVGFDTLSYSINIPDTVIAGDNAIWKIPNNITITEIAAFTNSGTVTFNIEERGETTPNTAGTDVIGSDLVADTDQQETSTFSNASIDRNDWLALVVASITGDPTLFGVTIRYIKAN